MFPIDSQACSICDAIVAAGDTYCDACQDRLFPREVDPICSWCESPATIDSDSIDARCSGCDRVWFPRDLTADIVAAFHAVGVAADVVGMGGGCESIRIALPDAAGRFPHVGDGNGCRPTTRALYAVALDEDDQDKDTAILSRDTDTDPEWDVTDAVAALVSAVVR